MFRQRGTPQPPAPPLRSTTRGRRLPRTPVDTPGLRLADAQGTASGRAARDLIADAFLPSQHLALEMLRRPIEFTQYASRRYRERLAEAGVRGSMSRTGTPYDNAQVESFIKTLKHEEVYLHEYNTLQDAIERLPHFLEEVYNRKRLHSALGYRPPEEYEALHAQTAA